MRTEIMKWFDMEAPVFAFSHCRDVVSAVSQNGGLGTLGTSHTPFEELRHDMEWLARHCPQRPIGFDVLFPSKAPHKFENMTAKEIEEAIPKEYYQFVDDLLLRHDLRPPTAEERSAEIRNFVGNLLRTHKFAEARLEIGYNYPNVKMIVSALGVPPKAQVERAHSLGIKVAAMVGHPKHVKYQLDAGVDILIAASYEAGGHTGDIAGMVLTPQIVDAAGPDVPVLHAGGIAKGSQIAAALALGAQGVWAGSVWLTTPESDTEELNKDLLVKASSSDTVRTKTRTGKPTRHLVTDLVKAWDEPNAPPTLPTPLQGLVSDLIITRATKAECKALVSQACGQGVGMMGAPSNVRNVMYGFATEFQEAMERLDNLFKSED